MGDLRSRKFRAMTLDAIFAVVTLALSWWMSPEDLDRALLLIGILQPVVISYINGVAKEDAALKSNGNYKG